MISFRTHYEYKPRWRGGGLIVEVACVILSAAVGGWVLVVSPVQRPSWPGWPQGLSKPADTGRHPN